MRERRPRPLSAEERALWQRVAETAVPLDGRARPAPEPPPPSPPAPPPPAAPPRVPGPAAAQRPSPPKPAPGLAPIDRRTRARVARGDLPLDGRLDLHGLTQEDAHERLYGFLALIQARGGRLVLVITGKGSSGVGGERGVLRRSVPHWLGSPRFRPLVVGFDEAHRSHGGEGAIYIRLRRRAAPH